MNRNRIGGSQLEFRAVDGVYGSHQVLGGASIDGIEIHTDIDRRTEGDRKAKAYQCDPKCFLGLASIFVSSNGTGDLQKTEDDHRQVNAVT